MTPEDRKALAEQIDANPLTDIILDGIEKDATEALIHASTEIDRIEAQYRVRAARSFRQELVAALRTPQPKGSIA